MDEVVAKEQSAEGSSSSSSSNKDETNIKETIESILIAFILAFIFRGFVVEAFVIPTGSMAPTLMGAHMRYRCDDCGYEFTVNYTANGEGDDVTPPSRADEGLADSQGHLPVDRAGNPIHKIFNVICPNCGYRMQKQPDYDPDNSAVNPPVHFGDRILVLKYLYLFQKPSRWDVVVFKSPDVPSKYDYQQNYIKRLIGRPGEDVMLMDGDVYIAPDNDGADPKLEDFVVQTKPRKVQDALWRVVYDNDYYPQNAASGRSNGTERNWQQPWTPRPGTSGWQALNGRVFNFDNANGVGEIYYDKSVNPQKQSLTDWLAYDVTINQGPGDDRDPREGPDAFSREMYAADDNVSDLRLSFYYQRQSGQGAVSACLSKIDDTFIAQIENGKVTLFRQPRGGSMTPIASASITADLSQPTRVDFINCDYQLIVRINDRDVITTTPQQYHPDLPMLMEAFRNRESMGPPSVRIFAANQKCTVSHLSLWRDMYYMNRQLAFRNGGLLRLNHGTPDNFPANVMRLKANPAEYFCCGDNSPISGDGRYWDVPIDLKHEDLQVDSGKVPQRFLLGKAFFVYWPAGFKPVESAPSFLPNFGDMRFIH